MEQFMPSWLMPNQVGNSCEGDKKKTSIIKGPFFFMLWNFLYLNLHFKKEKKKTGFLNIAVVFLTVYFMYQGISSYEDCDI